MRVWRGKELKKELFELTVPMPWSPASCGGWEILSSSALVKRNFHPSVCGKKYIYTYIFQLLIRYILINQLASWGVTEPSIRDFTIILHCCQILFEHKWDKSGPCAMFDKEVVWGLTKRSVWEATDLSRKMWEDLLSAWRLREETVVSESGTSLPREGKHRQQLSVGNRQLLSRKGPLDHQPNSA